MYFIMVPQPGLNWLAWIMFAKLRPQMILVGSQKIMLEFQTALTVEFVSSSGSGASFFPEPNNQNGIATLEPWNLVLGCRPELMYINGRFL